MFPISESVNCLISQPTPRIVDEGIKKQALYLYFPKPLIILFYIIPVFMFVVCVFVMSFIITSGRYEEELRLIAGERFYAAGKVTKTEKLKTSKGAITYMFDFVYQPGKEDKEMGMYKGFCFSKRPEYRENDTATIEHLLTSPEIARIKNCSMNNPPIYFLALLPLFFAAGPLVPFCLLFYRKRWIDRILQDGILTTATVTDIKPGPKNTKIIHVCFEVDGETKRAKIGQIQLTKQLLERAVQFKERQTPLNALVEPVKKKSLFILDFITEQSTKMDP